MTRDELIAMLVCPMGKKPLTRDNDSLICTHCGTKYAIEDGIPNMLIEEATLPDGCASIAALKCVKSGEVKYDG
ncbi:MAG: Trm112 family protein [Isosphaeraceae bacterium]